VKKGRNTGEVSEKSEWWRVQRGGTQVAVASVKRYDSGDPNMRSGESERV
jgi:hypothetical protein